MALARCTIPSWWKRERYKKMISLDFHTKKWPSQSRAKSVSQSENSHKEFQAAMKCCATIHKKYLRLLLSLLILEVLGVLTSSHCLKFCSNTYRKGYLQINNKLSLNTLSLYSEKTLQTSVSSLLFLLSQTLNRCLILSWCPLYHYVYRKCAY